MHQQPPQLPIYQLPDTLATLADCTALDARDPLGGLRDAFELPPGVIYLDGNSLGALPKATASRVAQVVAQEWGQGLIRSWNSAGWFAAPQRVGDQIAKLLGAQPGEVVATDSTSVNIYKVLHAALVLAKERGSARTVVSERSNFPTDLYIAHSLCAQHGFTLQLVERAQLHAALTPDVALLMLTHVHYRSGTMHAMADMTARAHAVGALVVWDLAHSAGAVPVDLHAADADFAVGCGYKFLNGGPGAPAFVWVHPRHVNHTSQPLTGWFGHAAPFAFTPGYAPAVGINRYLCGTPPVINMAALESGLSVFEAAQALGGMAALRAKSLALSGLFIKLVQERIGDRGLALVSPLAQEQRGSQVSYTRPEGGYAIMQALIARGVIGDFRAGDASAPAQSEDRLDILRFGFAPLYNRFSEVWDAVEQLRQVLETGQWQQPEFNRTSAVT